MCIKCACLSACDTVCLLCQLFKALQRMLRGFLPSWAIKEDQWLSFTRLLSSCEASSHGASSLYSFVTYLALHMLCNPLGLGWFPILVVQFGVKAETGLIFHNQTKLAFVRWAWRGLAACSWLSGVLGLPSRSVFWGTTSMLSCYASRVKSFV